MRGDTILTGDLLRGHTDAIILQLLKQNDSYGYELNMTIAKISDNHFILTEATMYTTLKRLEKNSLITSYWKDGVNTKRKYYSITTQGLKYLLEHKQDWLNTKKILTKILEDDNER